MAVIVLVKEKAGWKRLCAASSRGSLSKMRDALKSKRMVAIVEAGSLASAIERTRTQPRPDRLLYRDSERTQLCAVVYGSEATEAFSAYSESIIAAVVSQTEIESSAAMVSPARTRYCEQ